MVDWIRVRELFDSSMRLPPGDRREYLKQNSAGDPVLFDKALALVSAAEGSGDFLEVPAAERLDLSVPAQSLVGTTIDRRYDVTGLIGEGGFAKAYLAEDRKLENRKVVLKVMNSFIGSDLGFEKEVNALSRIDHPGVVGILDTGSLLSGQRFVVLRHVPGRTLAELLESGPLPLPEVSRLAVQLGEALQAAHDSHVWHRDLKPANIVIQPDHNGVSRAVILDFGISAIRTGDSPQTMTFIAGTSGYMAPEQFRGKAGPASDIFSMAVVIYEAVSGQRWSDVPETDSIENAVRDALARCRPDVSAKFAYILAQAFHPQPSERPANAGEFGRNLAESISPVLSRRKLYWVLAAVPMLLTTLFVGNRLNRSPAITPAKQQIVAFSARIICADSTTTRNQLVAGCDDRTHFRAGERIRIEAEVGRSGHFYVFNADLAAAQSSPLINVLEPGSWSNQAAGRRAEGSRVFVPAEHKWLTLDESPAGEVLWLVWSPDPVKELQGAAPYAGAQGGYRISDKAVARQIDSWLQTASHAGISAQKTSDRGTIVLSEGGSLSILKILLSKSEAGK